MDDFFDDGFGFDDAAIIGGIFGYAEEEARERKRLEREFEDDEPVLPGCPSCPDCDPFDDDDGESLIP